MKSETKLRCFFLSEMEDCVFHGDLGGPNLDWRTVPSPEACHENCKAIANCLFWQFRLSDKLCIAKSGKSSSNEDNDWVAGDRDCPPQGKQISK